MKMDMKAFCIILAFVAIGCKPDYKVLDNTDPFRQSFWGKDISVMMKKHCKDDSCRTFHDVQSVYTFDQNGNIIEEDTGFGSNRDAYNNEHFLVRYLYRSDTYVNEIYSYSLDEDQKTLNRYCYPIRGRDWDFNSDDLDSTRMYAVKYKLNEEGKIFEEVNPDRRTVTNFFYEFGQLKKKKLIRDDKVLEEWTYRYRGNQIQQMDHDVPSIPGETTNYFFSDKGDLLFSKTVDVNGKPHFAKYFFTLEACEKKELIITPHIMN